MRRLTHDRVQPVSAAWALAMSLGTTARWLSTAYRSFDVDPSLTKPSREVHQAHPGRGSTGATRTSHEFGTRLLQDQETDSTPVDGKPAHTVVHNIAFKPKRE